VIDDQEACAINLLYTIGHSNLELGRFIDLLMKNRISAVADVRSIPVSRFAPQFSRDHLENALVQAKIHYVYLGRELGARPDDDDCIVDGRVQFNRLARTPRFLSGIERLVDGSKRHSVAIMCTEKDPLDCHRTILIARVLNERGLHILHIHGDGGLERHADAMDRLKDRFELGRPDLFSSPEDLLAEALSRQERRIAFVPNRTEVTPTS